MKIIDRLRAIKKSLEIAHRFYSKEWCSAIVQNERHIEELLIDYGFDISNERDPDETIRVRLGYVVQGYYLEPDGNRVWKDWLRETVDLKDARFCEHNFKRGGWPKNQTVGCPNNSRIIERLIIDEVV